jgi:AP-1 complex subunit mu
MSAVEKFPILLSEAEEESSAVPPCFSDEGINVCCSSPRIAPPGALPFPNTNPPTSRHHHYDTNHTTFHLQYLYIRHNNLYLLALTKRNTNAAEILLFLHKIVEVFTEYFKELEEESIRDNFVVIYELLDEMMDFGYPQTTETKILQEYVRRGVLPFPSLPLCNSRPIAQTNNLLPNNRYITQESHKLEIQARPPIAVTNAVSWRSEGIRYRKNEVFLDVIESLNLLVSSNGNVLRSEILGAIKMKCYLSGMPELRLGLNDKVMFETTGRATRGKAVEMEDVKFHQCVRLSRFENDRTISFIPPDGEFELMSYRLNTQVKPLIWVECVVESHSGSRIEYMLKVSLHSLPSPTTTPLTPPSLGKSPIQAPQHSKQRRDPGPRPRRRRLPALPHKHRQRALRAREIRHNMEDQAIRRRQGIPDACRAGSALRQRGR